MTSCSLRNHIKSFVEENRQKAGLLRHIETLKVFQTSAVFHSIFQNQADALSAQTEMLHFMSIYDSDVTDEQKNALTSITIPIKAEARKVLQVSVEHSFIENGLRESAIVDPDVLREMGNTAFRNKREHDAIQLYTEGIKCSQPEEADTRLYLNRSLCYLRITDFERALADADYCIGRDAGNWKAYYRRATAIANLVQTSNMPKTTLIAGLAAASIASYMNPEVKQDSSINMLYPVLNIRLVTNPSHLMNELWTVSSQPYTTLLLGKGIYHMGHFPIAEGMQIIGIENEVEIFFENVLHISPWNISDPDCEIHVYFENISFIKGVGQISANLGATVTFYRCRFSNSSEACEDYPHCKGGGGCKNPNPNDCLLQFQHSSRRMGTGFFHTGVGGSPAICAVDGGRIYLERCIFDACSGGGALSDGLGSFLKATKCVVINNRQSGLEARNGGELFATDNIIQQNHQHGILIGPYGKGFVANNVISGNRFEGVYCCEHERGHEGLMMMSSFGSSSSAVVEDNIVSHNGLCGISIDGGTYIINNNQIFDNWCWGIMAKTRASCHITNNDIYSNICGGIRIGFNYSATLYLDANTIRDHTGPYLYTLDFPMSHRPILKSVEKSDKVRNYLKSYGMPDDEVTQYTSPPIVTNRNVFRHNDMRIQHPSEQLVVPNICALCHKNGKSMKKCASCAKAFYCNRECQTKHWIRHKHFCEMFKEKFTVSIDIKNTRTFGDVKPGQIPVRTFNHSLKGTGTGPKPDRKSRKRFIVKIQSGLEYSKYDPYTYMLLYDKSVDVDFEFCNPQLYHLVMECGILAGNTFTTKKIYCWASFEEKGRILKVYTDNLPPFQSW